jgi:hypothetical protein
MNRTAAPGVAPSAARPNPLSARDAQPPASFILVAPQADLRPQLPASNQPARPNEQRGQREAGERQRPGARRQFSEDSHESRP